MDIERKIRALRLGGKTIDEIESILSIKFKPLEVADPLFRHSILEKNILNKTAEFEYLPKTRGEA